MRKQFDTVVTMLAPLERILGASSLRATIQQLVQLFDLIATLKTTPSDPKNPPKNSQRNTSPRHHLKNRFSIINFPISPQLNTNFN
jgi:hypothetical protein